MSETKSFGIRPWHIITIITALIVYFYAFNEAPSDNGEELLFWGYMHIALHGLCIALYFIKNNRKSSYPFIAYFSFFQLISFGIPVFFISKTKFLFSYLTAESLEYAFYAYLLIYSAFWLFSLVLFRHIRPFQSLNQLPLKKLRLVLFGFFLLILVDYLKLIPSLIQLVSIVKNVYIGLSLMLIFQHKIGRWEKTGLFGILVIEILNRAVSGLIAEVAILLLFIIVVLNICSVRMVYLLPLVIPFLLFYSAFSKVKFEYREKVWYSKKSFSIKEKLFLIYELSQKNTQKVQKADKKGGDNFFLRYSYSSSIFSRVLRKTPMSVPYWDGETYMSLFSKFIPRTLWPDKPRETLGHDFGVRYGIIAQSDKVTSINTPVLVEMFVNFGLSGLFIGSTLFGILLLFIDRYFCSDVISLENKIINSSITFTLLIIEGNFSLVFGNLFLFCLVLYLIFRFAK